SCAGDVFRERASVGIKNQTCKQRRLIPTPIAQSYHMHTAEVLADGLQIPHHDGLKSTTPKTSLRWKRAINGFAGADCLDFLIIDEDKAFRDRTRVLIEGEGHYAE